MRLLIVPRTVLIYDNATLLETNILQHQELVWSIAFSENGSLFASGSATTVKVWDLDTSAQIISIRVPAVCMSTAFLEDDSLLLIVARNNSIIYWDIPNNVARGEPIDWTRDLLENGPQLSFRRPTIAAFSAEQNLLAIIYRGEDILLWTLDGEQIYDMYEKETGSCRYESTKIAAGSTTVWAVAFSSAVEQNLLVAAYSDGDMVIYDTDTGEPRVFLEDINAQTLACSPDGRTLATANSLGDISLFDLRTLKIIYRVHFNIDALPTKKLAFTSDNLRLLDIRGKQFRVWDPTVLLRNQFEDENSDTTPSSALAQEMVYDTGKEGIVITAMIFVRGAARVICGKEDGTVHMYNVASEPHSYELFTQTAKFAITLLHFAEESNILSCADTSGRVTSRKLSRVAAQGKWVAEEILFDKRNLSSIKQIISSPKHSRLLISTLPSDAIWSLSNTDAVDCIASLEGSPKQRWLTSPLNEDLLLRFDRISATFYSWEDLTPTHSISHSSLNTTSLDHVSIISMQHPQYFITVQAPKPSAPRSTAHIYHLWDIRDFIPKSGDSFPEESGAIIHPVLDFSSLGHKVETIVGVTNDRAIFLDADNWICSADIIKSSPSTLSNTTSSSSSSSSTPSLSKILPNAVRHFFIPDDWMSLVNTVLIETQHQSGDIVFVKRTDLAVIRRGLEITDKGVFGGGGRLSGNVWSTMPRRPAITDKRHTTE